ncbi:hypothetical protein EVJ29_06355 [Exiguobacterium sp. SH4S7]|uniref:hypothetical protein n=1 Tax=Exiguobacterium sp. SH4S7 TaxID=2510958 RepID=UPI00103CA9B2|nr:hypothetical protein [Exiguobacterium sp. SH4S7]TCI37642.1 hypothetical protein EVJ29_06355 [Exiguobacterium sp. SH4S7]
MAIDLDFLMSTEDYVLDTESFQMKGVTYYPLEWTCFGASDATMILTDDADRDRILIRFEQYALFLGTLEEHGMPEDGLANRHPIVKLKTSRFSAFAAEQMKTERVNTDRGELSHYVIRTFEQEFHVLAYEEPTVLDLGKVGDTGVVVTEVDEVDEF